MVSSQLKPSQHPLADYIYRLESGEALLKDTPENTLEVVGILKSYGIVLDAYSRNLIYIAEEQFLVLFPFFKYFNGEVNLQKLFRFWFHDRINYEYAEYCMRTMLWHGGGGLDTYVDSDTFRELAEKAIDAKLSYNFFLRGLHSLFPEFLPEQIRQSAYYSGLGQFWRVMSDIFMSLAEGYEKGQIKTIKDVVDHIRDGLVEAASKPITYKVKIQGKDYDIIPKSVGLTFLADTAIPYVDTIFFRGTPFPGTVSYNAQAYQIPVDQADFTYGALYADPLPIGGAGIPPTLLMHDMRHFIPDYLHEVYANTKRKEDDVLVQICQTFQKSMFCVTTAAIQGLAPHPFNTTNPQQQEENRAYLEQWMNRFVTSRVSQANA